MTNSYNRYFPSAMDRDLHSRLCFCWGFYDSNSNYIVLY